MGSVQSTEKSEKGKGQSPIKNPESGAAVGSSETSPATTPPKVSSHHSKGPPHTTVLGVEITVYLHTVKNNLKFKSALRWGIVVALHPAAHPPHWSPVLQMRLAIVYQPLRSPLFR